MRKARGSRSVVESTEACGDRGMGYPGSWMQFAPIGWLRLAEAYIPPQVYGVMFEPMRALCAGTVFPELYMPYAVRRRWGMRYGW